MLQDESLYVECTEMSIHNVRQNFEFPLVLPTFLIHCEDTGGKQPMQLTMLGPLTTYKQFCCVVQFVWAYQCSHFRLRTQRLL